VFVENRETIGIVNVPAPRFTNSIAVPCVLKTPP
jgi:hypothetical protein